MSKLLGKWTIDKRTSGESKESSGSYSENYDVLGRELMLEYEQMEQCQFLNEESVEYLTKQKDKNENIQMYEMDAFAFMMMDLDGLEKKIHSTPNDKKGQGEEITITAGMIESALAMEKKQMEDECKEDIKKYHDSRKINEQ